MWLMCVCQEFWLLFGKKLLVKFLKIMIQVLVETKCFEIVLRRLRKKPESFSQGIKHVTFALLVQMPGTTEAQKNWPAGTTLQEKV